MWHRTVLNLGHRDLLTAHLDLDKLMRLLATQCWMTLFGAMTFARLRRGIGGQCWWRTTCGHELGLDATLDKLAAPNRRGPTSASDRALVWVVNRLTTPGSEHGLARSSTRSLRSMSAGSSLGNPRC
jgi:hypothetical protein